MEIDLLNANSVRDFSNGSAAVYVPNNQHNRPEMIVNLNVTDAPNGIYTLKTVPAANGNGTQEHVYNLLVNTESVHLNEKYSVETATGKWELEIEMPICTARALISKRTIWELLCLITTSIYVHLNWILVDSWLLIHLSIDHHTNNVPQP